MSTKEHTTIRRARVGRQPVVPAALLLAFVFFTTGVRGQEARVEPGDRVIAPEAGDAADDSGHARDRHRDQRRNVDQGFGHEATRGTALLD